MYGNTSVKPTIIVSCNFVWCVFIILNSLIKNTLQVGRAHISFLTVLSLPRLSLVYTDFLTLKYKNGFSSSTLPTQSKEYTFYKHNNNNNIKF